MRKRRRPTPASRIRPYWILVVLIGMLLGAGIIFLIRWDGFFPHPITVTGNKVVLSDTVTSAAAIDRRQNIWLQNVAAMQDRIEAIPYIDLARVHRYLPARVVIEVTERFPIGVLTARNGAYLIDQRLRVLDPATGGEKLPHFEAPDITVGKVGDFIFDDRLVALRNDADLVLGAHIDAVDFAHDKYGDLDVELRSGVRVLFGDEADLEKKIPLIDPILEQARKTKRPVATIDVRAPSAPIMIYKM